MKNGLEKYLLRPVLSSLLRAAFRVQVAGLENYHQAAQLATQSGSGVVVISNHLSYLDPFLLSVFLPEKPRFAMNLHQARKWYFRWLDLIITTYKIDPLTPMSLKGLMTDVKNGARLVIFPEGRISTSGGIMKIYDGAGKIIEKTGAVLLPVHISGTEYSKVSRLGKKLRTRFFPQVTISILPPVRFAENDEISAQRIYDIMSEAAFAASNYRRPLLLAIIEAAELHGARHRIATDISREHLNYRQLFTRSFILSDKLEQVLGAEKFVAMMLPNSLGALVTFTSLQILGKVPAMLNFSAGLANISHAARLATVRHILTSRAFVEKANLGHIVVELAKNYEVIYLEDIRKEVGIADKLRGLMNAVQVHDNLRAKLARINADDVAVVLFTSGSEGVPKGVALSHANLLANINQSCAVLDITPSDVLFNAMPMFHSFGLTIGTLMPLVRGVTTFLYPSPVHYRVIPELIYDTNTTIIIGTDTFMNGYARYANPYDFYSVRFAVMGAEKLRESTRRLYADKFRVNLMQGYGVTEASPVISCNTLVHNKVGTVGRPFPAIKCRVEPVAGLERGGRLQVSGANIMLGYIRENNVGVVEPQGEWYDTGDIVEIDNDGFITIVGRAKRFAKIGGEMVSLQVVEELAGSLFAEHAHAALAEPDEGRGERIVLYSETRDLTRETLQEAAHKRGIAEIALPKKIVFIAEIPRLGSGKIDYHTLTITTK